MHRQSNKLLSMIGCNEATQTNDKGSLLDAFSPQKQSNQIKIKQCSSSSSCVQHSDFQYSVFSIQDFVFDLDSGKMEAL